MVRVSLALLFSLVFIASAQEKAGGKLKVTIKPSDAVSAGAKWQVDSDGVWRNSGDSVSNIPAGDHSVTFKKITNWKAPKAQTVTIVDGQTTNFKKKYKYKGPTNEQTILLPGNVPLVLVSVPAGSFNMGRYTDETDSLANEDPQHQVNFANGFWIGKYEITKGQWQALMGTTPWSGQGYSINNVNSPAVYISWNDAKAFVTALNTHITNTAQGSATCRLPSEAEWEYACRAGTTTRFYWGEDASLTSIGSYAWWNTNAWTAGEAYGHVVGTKLPNAWGVYDASGNVWEWCEDWYHSSYTDAPTDGSAWLSPAGSSRVARGGGWYNTAPSQRSAGRNSAVDTYSSNDFGFRIAR